jgi:hypothetical protein
MLILMVVLFAFSNWLWGGACGVLEGALIFSVL